MLSGLLSDPFGWVRGRERACALAGAVTIAFSSILVRLSHASPSTAAIFRCAYALPLLALLAFVEDRRFGSRSWRQRRGGVVAGVFFAADLLLWHHAIGDVGAGLATVMANIQVVLVPLVAWAVLAEAPGRAVLAALPVALFGVLLISGVLEHGAYGHNPTRGTLFALGAGVAYVGFLLLLRHGGADLRRPAGPLCDATAVAAVLCVAAGLAIGDARLVPTWPSAGWLIVLALTSQVLGWLLIGTSLPRLPAAMTSMLLTVQPVGTVLLAALILGESPSGLQLVGVALVLGALLIAGRSGRALEEELPIGEDLLDGSARTDRQVVVSGRSYETSVSRSSQ
jgi:drug/metabolite transporter (DMT)-like permease